MLQELRRLVRKVHVGREQLASSEGKGEKLDKDVAGAERSLARFLRGLAKQLPVEQNWRSPIFNSQCAYEWQKCTFLLMLFFMQSLSLFLDHPIEFCLLYKFERKCYLYSLSFLCDVSQLFLVRLKFDQPFER